MRKRPWTKLSRKSSRCRGGTVILLFGPNDSLEHVRSGAQITDFVRCIHRVIIGILFRSSRGFIFTILSVCDFHYRLTHRQVSGLMSSME